METKAEFIKRSFDANAFITSDQYATAVNPKVWDTQLRDYVQKNIIFTNHCQQYDFRKPGRDLTVTVDAAPTAAGALVETDAVAVQPISNRQVTFTPVEYGTQFQSSKSETEDAFFDVAANVIKKLGYSLALKKDAIGYAAAVAGATTAYTANNVASTDIASSDTIKLADFTKSRARILSLGYNPVEVIIGYGQEQQVLDISQVQKANEFGVRDAIDRGLIGQLFGIKIYVADSVTTASNKAKAIFLGESRASGEKAVGYAQKRDPTVEMFYDADFRQYKWTGTERYGFSVLHPDAIVTLESYSAF